MEQSFAHEMRILHVQHDEINTKYDVVLTSVSSKFQNFDTLKEYVDKKFMSCFHFPLLALSIQASS